MTPRSSWSPFAGGTGSTDGRPESRGSGHGLGLPGRPVGTSRSRRCCRSPRYRGARVPDASIAVRCPCLPVAESHRPQLSPSRSARGAGTFAASDELGPISIHHCRGEDEGRLARPRSLAAAPGAEPAETFRQDDRRRERWPGGLLDRPAPVEAPVAAEVRGTRITAPSSGPVTLAPTASACGRAALDIE